MNCREECNDRITEIAMRVQDVFIIIMPYRCMVSKNLKKQNCNKIASSFCGQCYVARKKKKNQDGAINHWIKSNRYCTGFTIIEIKLNFKSHSYSHFNF